MPTDGLFAPIVSTDELLAATGDGAWLAALLDTESALARAQAEAGIIPAAAAAAIAAACQAADIDPAAMGRAARAGGNPVIPLVRVLSERVGPDGSDWVHWGATSQDILDTAAALVAHRAGRIIETDLSRLADGCAELAGKHRRTIMVGRTLLQPALPITFGLKAAGWLVGVTDCRAALGQALAGLPVQMGGAAGTAAALHGHGPEVASLLAGKLGLAEAVMPWHSSRQKMVALASALALAAGTAAKISGDVALLMQEEIGEVSEPAQPGRGGSSTLPQKRNPVGAAAAGAAARRATALVGLFFESLSGEHERSLVAWPVEWQSLGDLLALSGGAVARTAETVAGLEVDAAAMAARVHGLAGPLMAERLALALAPRMGRAAARHAVAEAGGRAEAQTGAGWAAALMADARVAEVVSPAELDDMLQPAGYLGSADEWIDRALAHHTGGTP